MIKEFEEFLKKGNVLDLAIGVVIGAALGKIVTSLVTNILMPLIGIILGGLNFASLSFTIGNSYIYYGLFIQSVVDFLIVAAVIFMFIKFLNKIKKPKPEVKIVKSEDIKLLEEIRDLLKKK